MKMIKMIKQYRGTTEKVWHVLLNDILGRRVAYIAEMSGVDLVAVRSILQRMWNAGMVEKSAPGFWAATREAREMGCNGSCLEEQKRFAQYTS